MVSFRFCLARASKPSLLEDLRCCNYADSYLGWVVEFLISVRKGEPSKVGYVASGFWGGLALGRIALADITHKLGDRHMVFLYLALAVGLQLLFWFVPNIVANAVAISLLGFVIAPFFPVGLSILTRLLPKDLHVASIGMICIQLLISFSNNVQQASALPSARQDQRHFPS